MNLKLFTVIIGLLILSTSKAQVTKLNNNGWIQRGVSLGNVGIMTSATEVGTDSIWRTDGTPGGTKKFTKQMEYGNFLSYGNPKELVYFKSKVFFPGREPGGISLYYTGGTSDGTGNINYTFNWSPRSLFVFNNLLIFYGRYGSVGDYELFKTDGTQAGTSLLADLNPTDMVSGIYSSSEVDDPKYFLNPNTDVVFFRAFNAHTGLRTYRTNGTTEGTYLLKDSLLGRPVSGHLEMEALGNLVIYSIQTQDGIELYKSDGTTAGTSLLKDINPGLASFIPAGFLLFKNKMYFTANDGTNGMELWVTDGTTAGTVMVKNINIDAADSKPDLSKAIIIDNRFIFSATTVSNGYELWSSDGTEAGTQLLKDINPGPGSSNPYIMLDSSSNKHSEIHTYMYNGKVFFYADNGSAGNELWITDGTATGTQLVADINPGASSSYRPGFFRYSRSGLYFSADNGTHGEELWKSDGTQSGTTLVVDIKPGAGSSTPRFAMHMKEELYFTANDGDHETHRDLYKVNAPFVTLPLTLANFSATPAGQSALLKWTTTHEVNTSHTEVERSADGTTFTSIGKVTSNNAALNTYSFSDENTVSGNNYYRLKFIDKDGAFQYSSVKLVSFKGISTVVVNNNPVSNTLKLSINLAKKSNATFSIAAADGRLIKRVNMSLGEGKTQKDIDVSELAQGMYILTMYEGSNKVTSSKFLKQ